MWLFNFLSVLMVLLIVIMWWVGVSVLVMVELSLCDVLVISVILVGCLVMVLLFGCFGFKFLVDYVGWGNWIFF